MPSASFIQSLMAGTRAKYGGRVALGGKAYSMTTRSLEPREREYLPEGIGNAADADLRLFCVTPTDFPVWPALGSVLVWEGVRFTLIAVRPSDGVIGSTLTALEFFVYKKPPDDSATAIAPAEAAASGQPQEAGQRVAFRPKSTNTS